jgi:hypothetical protein
VLYRRGLGTHDTLAELLGSHPHAGVSMKGNPASSARPSIKRSTREEAVSLVTVEDVGFLIGTSDHKSFPAPRTTVITCRAMFDVPRELVIMVAGWSPLGTSAVAPRLRVSRH